MSFSDLRRIQNARIAARIRRLEKLAADLSRAMPLPHDFAIEDVAHFVPELRGHKTIHRQSPEAA